MTWSALDERGGAVAPRDGWTDSATVLCERRLHERADIAIKLYLRMCIIPALLLGLR